MVSTDAGLADYLNNVLHQMSGLFLMDYAVIWHQCMITLVSADWLIRGELQKMVLVITSSETREVLERWTFDLLTDKAVVQGG